MKIKASVLFLALLWTFNAYAFHSATVAVDQAELKAGPSADSATTTTLPAGTPLNVSDHAKNGYFRATSATATGWISAESLGMAATPPPPAEAPVQAPEQQKQPEQQPQRAEKRKPHAEPDWALGFEIGADISNASYSTSGLTGTLSSSSTTGFLLGGTAEYHLSGIWYLESGLRYDQRSASGTLTPTSGTAVSFQSKASWIEIPLLVKVKFDAGGWWPYLFTGLEPGFKLSESDSNSAATSTTTTSSSLNSVNISWDIGAGAEFRLSDSIRLFGAFGYSLGLSNLASSGGALNGSSVKLNALLFSTGLSFAL